MLGLGTWVAVLFFIVAIQWLSHLRLLVTLWTVPPAPGSSVHGILQARIWSGLPLPPLGDLPDLGIELESPAL